MKLTRDPSTVFGFIKKAEEERRKFILDNILVHTGNRYSELQYHAEMILILWSEMSSCIQSGTYPEWIQHCVTMAMQAPVEDAIECRRKTSIRGFPVQEYPLTRPCGAKHPTLDVRCVKETGHGKRHRGYRDSTTIGRRIFSLIKGGK